MSICRIIETPATPEQYDQIRTRLGVDENNPPPGGKVHVAAKGDDGKSSNYRGLGQSGAGRGVG